MDERTQPRMPTPLQQPTTPLQQPTTRLPVHKTPSCVSFSVSPAQTAGSPLRDQVLDAGRQIIAYDKAACESPTTYERCCWRHHATMLEAEQAREPVSTVDMLDGLSHAARGGGPSAALNGREPSTRRAHANESRDMLKSLEGAQAARREV